MGGPSANDPKPGRVAIPGWARPFTLPIALSALAALYLAAVRHAPLTPGVVLLCLGAAVIGLVAHHVVGAADAIARGADEVEERETLGRRRRDLLREKQALLKALKELELDHAMGKLDDADFGEIGEKLRGRARRVLRALDPSSSGYHAVIEDELRRRRSERPEERADS